MFLSLHIVRHSSIEVITANMLLGLAKPELILTSLSNHTHRNIYTHSDSHNDTNTHVHTETSTWLGKIQSIWKKYKIFHYNIHNADKTGSIR